VERMLDKAREANAFFDELTDPESGIPTRVVHAEELNPIHEESAGTVIGRYKLLQKIGEGGMGVVYMAEQTKPIQRMVALKIIKLGMDTRTVIARFEAEQQALAMMNPHGLFIWSGA